MHTSGGDAETRPGGLRNRWLAPVYALVIAFLAVLLLGAVAREPDVPPPSTVAVQFVPNLPEGTQVKVLAANASDHTVNGQGRVDVGTSGKPFTVCVQLPAKWSAPAPAARFGDYACWPPVDPDAVDPGGRVELVVTPAGTG